MVRKSTRKLICFVLCAVLVFTGIMPVLAASTANLADVSGNKYESIIRKWVEKGFITGYPDGTFKPDNQITRAEFMAMVNRAFGFAETMEPNFSDVKSSDWFYGEVKKALKAGFMIGADGKMRPTDNINRQELAVIAARLGKLDTTVNDALLNGLKDAASIPAWSKGAVGITFTKGLFDGFVTDMFKPEENITRVEMVVVLDRLLASLGMLVEEPVKVVPSMPGLVAFMDGLYRVDNTHFSSTATKGKTFVLPKEIKFKLPDGSTQTAPITWSGSIDTSSTGPKTVTGTIAGYGSITVEVAVSAPRISTGGGGGGGGGGSKPNNPPAQANTAPATPVITRLPATAYVSPSEDVTITASSTDAENDAITYVWTGRLAQTSKYPLGRHVITCKAVDEHGLESAQTALVFFVMDGSTGAGGMLLTDKESRIYENGIHGATITKYTFNVPPVDGHSGEDYAFIRGLNRNTHVWEEIDYETTENGILMEGTLPAGVYHRLELFYYASHCMYGKSNITYTVEFTFDAPGTVITMESEPVASAAAITGTATERKTLTGSYTYADANGDLEGASTYKWYAADDSEGTNKTAIAGATGETYTLTAADVGKYISFEVTPVALTGVPGTITGTKVESDSVGPVVADPLRVNTGSLQYTDNTNGSGTFNITVLDQDGNNFAGLTANDFVVSLREQNYVVGSTPTMSFEALANGTYRIIFNAGIAINEVVDLTVKGVEIITDANIVITVTSVVTTGSVVCTDNQDGSGTFVATVKNQFGDKMLGLSANDFVVSLRGQNYVVGQTPTMSFLELEDGTYRIIFNAGIAINELVDLIVKGVTIVNDEHVVISVPPSHIPVDSVSLGEDNLLLTIGNVSEHTLVPAILPANATDKTVIWTSSDEGVVTVDGNGKVTAVGTGKATVTVTTNDNAKTDSCEFTVAKYVDDTAGLGAALADPTVSIIALADGSYDGFTVSRPGVEIFALNEHKAVINGKIKIEANDVKMEDLAVDFTAGENYSDDDEKIPVVWMAADRAKVHNFLIDYYYHATKGINDGTYIMAIDENCNGSDIARNKIEKHFPEGWRDNSNWVSRAGIAAVMVKGDSNYNMIYNNKIKGGPIGVKSGVQDIQIGWNTIETVEREGIWIVGAQSINSTYNNVIDNNIKDDGSCDYKIVNKPVDINDETDELEMEKNLLDKNEGIDSVCLQWIANVDDDYNDETLGWGVNRYNTIPEALASGKKLVIVHNGEYEAFTVQSDDTTVSAANGEYPEIDGTVIIKADRVRIHRLTINANAENPTGQVKGIWISVKGDTNVMAREALIDENSITYIGQPDEVAAAESGFVPAGIGIGLHAGYYNVDNDSYGNRYLRNMISGFVTGIAALSATDEVAYNEIIDALAGVGVVGGAADIHDNSFILTDQCIWKTAEAIGTHYAGNDPAVRQYLQSLFAKNTFDEDYELGIVMAPGFSGFAKVAYYGDPGLYVGETVHVDDDWAEMPYGTEVDVEGEEQPYFIGVDAFAGVNGGVNAAQWTFDEEQFAKDVTRRTVKVAAGIYDEDGINIIGTPISIVGTADGETIVNLRTWDNGILQRVLPGFIVLGTPGVEISGLTIRNVNMEYAPYYENITLDVPKAAEEPTLDATLQEELTDIVEKLEEYYAMMNKPVSRDSIEMSLINYEPNRIGILLLGTYDCKVSNNEIEGLLAGVISALGGGVAPSLSEEQLMVGNTITGNYFHGNRFAYTQAIYQEGTAINGNHIQFNNVGVANLALNELDATRNWWGTNEYRNIAPFVLDVSSLLNNGHECLTDYFPWAMDEDFEGFATESELLVDDSWAGREIGEYFEEGDEQYYFGFNAFSRIGDAVNSVRNGTEEVTITVRPGDYYEYVKVERPNVNLVGPAVGVDPRGADECGEEARWHGVAGSGHDVYALDIYDDNVVVDGFTFADSFEAVYLEAGSNIAVRNNRFVGNGYGVIALGTEDDIAINYNTFTGNAGCGVQVIEGKGISVYNNEFADNGSGIEAFDVDGLVSITENSFEQTGIGVSTIEAKRVPYVTSRGKVFDVEKRAAARAEFSAMLDRSPELINVWGVGVLIEDVDSVNMSVNVLTGFETAVVIYNEAEYSEQNFFENDIQGNRFGFDVYDEMYYEGEATPAAVGESNITNVSINENYIDDNGFDIYKAIETIYNVLDAQDNDWGEVDSQAEIIAEFDGDKEHILYIPWTGME